MLQNVKVDIIYYMMPTDFEMEFNLCGCCRMRLLTDKTNDRKSLIHALSRAVSRSRVILCIGPLFEETGLIHSVALAIGKPLEQVDNARYGIRGSNEISVIKGAMPLVTSEGVFGGCIIESGPQSIVLLSESKGIRKSLMTALIHPYIEEISLIAPTGAGARHSAPVQNAAPAGTAEPAAEAAAAPEPDDRIPQVETEQTAPPKENPADADPQEAETAEEPEPMPEIQPVDDENDPPTPDPTPETPSEPEAKPGKMKVIMDNPTEELPMYIEAQEVKNSRKNYYDTSYGDNAETENYYISKDQSFSGRPSLRLPVLIISVILLLALLVLAYLLVFVPMREGYSIGEYFSQLFAPAAIFLTHGI